MRQLKRKPNAKRRSGADNIAKFKVEADAPLLQTAQAVLKDHSANKVKSMLRHNQLAVNGTPSTQFDRPVQAGDELWVNFDSSFKIFSHPRIKLLYEDDEIIVIDKGYGMLSTSAGKDSDQTVYSVLRQYVRAFNEHARVFVVHRLDRDTSGLMLLTRTAEARDKLVKNWSTMVTERKYEAVVEGRMEELKGNIESYLIDDENKFTVLVSHDPEEGGQFARTKYVTLDRGPRYSLVELSLKRGHKNQLRVHLASIGHPISGDRKYGGHPNPIHRLALHATQLSFVHPATGKEMHFESAVPQGFMTLMERSRR